MAAPPQQPAPTLNQGIVKQVMGGDTVIIRGHPKGGPPPEKQLYLSNITARKLARRMNVNSDAGQSTRDEPFAWEARELLRKKLVGKDVTFFIEYKVPTTGREYGAIYVGKDTTAENVTETLVSEGLVEVRRGSVKPSEEQQKLCELEDAAKAAGKGLWGKDAQSHVRDVKWSVENPRNFVDSLHQKRMKAVIEHVRDGSTVRAFLLPDFHHVTVMLSGIKCPMFKAGEDGGPQQPEPFAEEAKFFTESRLLQRDVEIILESASNNNFLGTIIHPKGNIAEHLLREGFARCVDWSIGFVSTGIDKLRSAEKAAKDKRLRIWKDYSPTGPRIGSQDKDFSATVVEIVNADALMVKLDNGNPKKIFLASVRPPRPADSPQTENVKEAKGRNFRPLYDIPYMYEAREFLRKLLIGQRVKVSVDYVQPASNQTSLPERTCCTVTFGDTNVAESLVSQGLASVVRYRQDDDQRSSRYDGLLSAENAAIKAGSGIHGKKEIPIHRVADVSGDKDKAKQFLPFLQRAGRSDATVEYVASGSRLRLYIPKETCLVTFLLAGINSPKVARPLPGGGTVEGEAWGDEALAFTKERCLQREVEVEVDTMDKAGNFIGWLWINGANHSVSLVEEGLASVHFTGERSAHARALQTAQDAAKERRQKIWENYEEPKEPEVKDDVDDRQVNYKSIVVTEVCPDLRFYAQHVEDGPKLEDLMRQIRQDFSGNGPLPGVCTPKRGDLCAAKFIDGLWYRARVEKVVDSDVHIFYVDYGNRETTKAGNLAILPTMYHMHPSAAHEYSLACAMAPKHTDYHQEVLQAFVAETQDRTLLLNTEYKVSNMEHVTLLNAENQEDIVCTLIGEGLLLAEMRREKRLQKLVTDYRNAQDQAKKKRLNIWCYGDFTEDDAKEFGHQR